MSLIKLPEVPKIKQAEVTAETSVVAVHPEDGVNKVKRMAMSDLQGVVIDGTKDYLTTLMGDIEGKIQEFDKNIEERLKPITEKVEYIFNAQATTAGSATECLAIKVYGKTILVDIGNNGGVEYAYQLWKNLTENEITHVDIIAISHWHKDHYGGLAVYHKIYENGVVCTNGKTVYEGLFITKPSAIPSNVGGYYECTVDGKAKLVFPLSTSKTSTRLITKDTKVYLPYGSPCIGHYPNGATSPSGSGMRYGGIVTFMDWMDACGVIDKSAIEFAPASYYGKGVNATTYNGKDITPALQSELEAYRETSDVYSVVTRFENEVENDLFGASRSPETDNENSIVLEYSKTMTPNKLFANITFPSEGDKLVLTKTEKDGETAYDLEYVTSTPKDTADKTYCEDEFSITFVNCTSRPPQRAVIAAVDDNGTKKYIYVYKRRYNAPNDYYGYRYEICTQEKLFENDVQYTKDFNHLYDLVSSGSAEIYRTERARYYVDLMQIQEEVDDFASKGSSSYSTRYIENDYSMCLLANHMGKTVFFSGDISRSAQEHIMRTGLVPAGIDLYKHNHHDANWQYKDQSLTMPQWAYHIKPKEIVVCCGINNSTKAFATDLEFYGNTPTQLAYNKPVKYISVGGVLFRKRSDLDITPIKRAYPHNRFVLFVDFGEPDESKALDNTLVRDGTYWRPFRRISDAVTYLGGHKDTISAAEPYIVVKCRAKNGTGNYLQHNYFGYSKRVNTGLVQNNDNWAVTKTTTSSEFISSYGFGKRINIVSEHIYRKGTPSQTATGKYNADWVNWIKLYRIQTHISVYPNETIRIAGFWLSKAAIHSSSASNISVRDNAVVDIQNCIADTVHTNGSDDYDEYKATTVSDAGLSFRRTNYELNFAEYCQIDDGGVVTKYSNLKDALNHTLSSGEKPYRVAIGKVGAYKGKTFTVTYKSATYASCKCGETELSIKWDNLYSVLNFKDIKFYGVKYSSFTSTSGNESSEDTTYSGVDETQNHDNLPEMDGSVEIPENSSEEKNFDEPEDKEAELSGAELAGTDVGEVGKVLYRYNKQTGLDNSNNLLYTEIKHFVTVLGNNAIVNISGCRMTGYSDIVRCNSAQNTTVTMNALYGDYIRRLCYGGKVIHENPHFTIRNLGLYGGVLNNSLALGAASEFATAMHFATYVEAYTTGDASNDSGLRDVVVDKVPANTPYTYSKDWYGVTAATTNAGAKTAAGDDYLDAATYYTKQQLSQIVMDLQKAGVRWTYKNLGTYKYDFTDSSIIKAPHGISVGYNGTAMHDSYGGDLTKGSVNVAMLNGGVNLDFVSGATEDKKVTNFDLNSFRLTGTFIRKEKGYTTLLAERLPTNITASGSVRIVNTAIGNVGSAEYISQSLYTAYGDVYTRLYYYNRADDASRWSDWSDASPAHSSTGGYATMAQVSAFLLENGYITNADEIKFDDKELQDKIAALNTAIYGANGNGGLNKSVQTLVGSYGYSLTDAILEAKVKEYFNGVIGNDIADITQIQAFKWNGSATPLSGTSYVGDVHNNAESSVEVSTDYRLMTDSAFRELKSLGVISSSATSASGYYGQFTFDNVYDGAGKVQNGVSGSTLYSKAPDANKSSGTTLEFGKLMPVFAIITGLENSSGIATTDEEIYATCDWNIQSATGIYASKWTCSTGTYYYVWEKYKNKSNEINYRLKILRPVKFAERRHTDVLLGGAQGQAGDLYGLEPALNEKGKPYKCLFFYKNGSDLNTMSVVF